MNIETQLTQDQLAANSVTWEHINLVMKLLASAQIELMRRQFTHDRSKLKSPEAEAFARYTPKLKNSVYGSDEYKSFLTGMEPALRHHYEHNRHHPEHFQNGVEGMTLFDLLEMFIDWCAAVQRHDDGNIYRSIEISARRFNLSPQLVQILENTIPWIKDEFSSLSTQKDITY